MIGVNSEYISFSTYFVLYFFSEFYKDFQKGFDYYKTMRFLKTNIIISKKQKVYCPCTFNTCLYRL